jgi:predicted molibdopterin-dependent oxidoreductase YjgC
MPTASRFKRLPNAAGVTLTIDINGQPHTVDARWTVAAALIAHGYAYCRGTAAGQPRGPFCFSGVCFECLVDIDGIPNRQACQTPVAEGMKVTIQIPPEASP